MNGSEEHEEERHRERDELFKSTKNNDRSQNGERAVSRLQKKKSSVEEYMPRKKENDFKGAQILNLMAYNSMSFYCILFCFKEETMRSKEETFPYRSSCRWVPGKNTPAL